MPFPSELESTVLQVVDCFPEEEREQLVAFLHENYVRFRMDAASPRPDVSAVSIVPSPYDAIGQESSHQRHGEWVSAFSNLTLLSYFADQEAMLTSMMSVNEILQQHYHASQMGFLEGQNSSEADAYHTYLALFFAMINYIDKDEDEV